MQKPFDTRQNIFTMQWLHSRNSVLGWQQLSCFMSENLSCWVTLYSLNSQTNAIYKLCWYLMNVLNIIASCMQDNNQPFAVIKRKSTFRCFSANRRHYRSISLKVFTWKINKNSKLHLPCNSSPFWLPATKNVNKKLSDV